MAAVRFATALEETVTRLSWVNAHANGYAFTPPPRLLKEERNKGKAFNLPDSDYRIVPLATRETVDA